MLEDGNPQRPERVHVARLERSHDPHCLAAHHSCDVTVGSEARDLVEGRLRRAVVADRDLADADVRIDEQDVGSDGNSIRLQGPVFHGDTLSAYTEVLEINPSGREDAGIVRFKH